MTTRRTGEGTTDTAGKCDACGADAISAESHVQTFTYGVDEEAVELSAAVQVSKCMHCGISYTDDRAEMARHEAVCKHLGVLTPSDIRQVRKDICQMTRAEFAELTGLAESSIGRWESGATIQSTANDRYLRLLRYPDVLHRLRKMGGTEEQRFPVHREFRALRGSRELGKLKQRGEVFQLRKTG